MNLAPRWFFKIKFVSTGCEPVGSKCSGESCMRHSFVFEIQTLWAIVLRVSYTEFPLSCTLPLVIWNNSVLAHSPLHFLLIYLVAACCRWTQPDWVSKSAVLTGLLTKIATGALHQRSVAACLQPRNCGTDEFMHNNEHSASMTGRSTRGSPIALKPSQIALHIASIRLRYRDEINDQRVCSTWPKQIFA